MKRGMIFVSIFILLIVVSFASAQLNSSSSTSSGIESKAKQCINKKITDKSCANLGLDDKIFSVLSTNKCRTELLALRRTGGCFGKGTTPCEIKETAQATLVLSESGPKPTEQINWLLSQNKTADGVDQLIQIDSVRAASCNVVDPSSNIAYQVSIRDDKTITTPSSGNCLSVDSSGYWLQINPTCRSKEFEVSCSEDFTVSFLFRSQSSNQIYVLEESPKSTSAGGTEIIGRKEAFCFKRGGICDYEGTLWATMVLKKLNYNFSSYLPYLVVFSDDASNKKYLPESFLYYLTGGEDFLNDLLLKQKANSFWDETSGYGRYYDTPLAMLSVTGVSAERDGVIEWLGRNQGNDGCWEAGSISRTGFLLYSVWAPKGGSGGGSDCVSSGNFCVLGETCVESGGEILPGLTCSGFSVCCNKQPPLQTCEEKGYEVCQTSTQECFAGSEVSNVANLTSGQICCTGRCDVKTSNTNSCEEEFGSCTTNSKCPTGKKETTSYSCDTSSEICCVLDDSDGGKSYWWLWVLGILIILTVLAIIFREKLKDFYHKIKFRKSPPGSPQGMPIRPMPPQRRILPLQSRPIPPRPLGSNINNRSKDIDDVLKKLKEMGK